MGLIYAPITLRNPSKPHLHPVAVKALVDTGAVTMCIPEHLAIQLELSPIETRNVTVADGRQSLVPYAGPLQVTFGNRNSFGGALIMGDEAILGAIAMEDMDLLLSPTRKMVMVNPASPNFPMAIVK